MVGIKPALGLMCLLIGSTISTFASPVIGSETSTTATDTIAVDHNTVLTKRFFNPRQKWQSDELNCVHILNPAPGATYHPGYFVRLNYGAEQCDATAAGPWTIHLYNNLDIQGGRVSYDYHEVIASEVNENKTQYLWTIPSNQNSKTKNVKKTNEYYVRIETNSQEGVKLVGNAGPFAISPQRDSNGGLRTLAEDASHQKEKLKRREDASVLLATKPEGNFFTEFALLPHKPSPMNEVVFSPSIPSVTAVPSAATVADVPAAISVPVIPAAAKSDPATPATTPALVSKDAVAVTAGSETTNANIPADVDVATDSNGSRVQLSDLKTTVSVDTKDKNSEIAAVVAPTARDPAAAGTTTGGSGITETPAITEVPEPHNTAPTDEIHPPVIEIAHTSFIPSKVLVAGAIAGGATGAGIVGASFFGQVGGVIGAVVGGIVGGVAVLLNFVGVPV
ncbi:hypothetical protein BG015_005744 [Linnemannia schmuckeri]|uniref:Uncharacterized protein n=1 Tax=Linnemannia schmuckeri TaxID=64567 RepID=A0A9P5S199_9FUNG|nr:hypothetical protein BG015_005744 [Linnemannia schmuckeri]